MQTICAGQFEITSGVARLTDPCYDKEVWCTGTVKAKNGTWISEYERGVPEHDFVEGCDRVHKIRAYHNSYLIVGGVMGSVDAVKLDIDVGVDSGQAGIFDDGLYPSTKKDIGEYGDTSTFYGKACECTTIEEDVPFEDGNILDPAPLFYVERIKYHPSAGIVDGFGVVASSGYGDGGYNAYAIFEGDEAIAIEIVFIGDENEDDEFDDEEDLEDE